MPKPIRPIHIEGNVAYITLTKGYTSVIDAADVHLVDGRNWQAQVERRADGTVRAVYAVRNDRLDGRQKTVLMHRVVAGTPEGFETDHRDGNGLNNLRANLRNATPSQNQHNQSTRSDNTSGHKGVYFHKAAGKWHARLKVAGKARSLGLFTDLAAASAAYAKASAELHGEFGRIA